MLKTTPILLIFLGLLFFAACKSDPKLPPPSAEEQRLIELAGPDYKKDLRLPVDPMGNVDTNSMAKISFMDQVFDFDTINAGDIVKHTYKFVNLGVKDLYITDTQATCGCTITKHTLTAIPPNQQGYVDVTYDSKDRNGLQEKVIKVYTNSYPNETLLKIKGFVFSPSANK